LSKLEKDTEFIVTENYIKSIDIRNPKACHFICLIVDNITSKLNKMYYYKTLTPPDHGRKNN
jgi:hypothetical protein